MTNPGNFVAIGTQLDLILKDISSAPLIAPNIGRVSATSGNLYLDLAFVDPTDIVEAVKKAPANTPVKVSGRTLARVVLSPETAHQILNLLGQQLHLIAQSQAHAQATAQAQMTERTEEGA